VCHPLHRPCTSDEYEAQSPNATHDRVCLPLTVCADAPACTMPDWEAKGCFTLDDVSCADDAQLLWLWSVKEGEGGCGEQGDPLPTAAGQDRLACFPDEPAFEVSPPNATVDRVCSCPAAPCLPGTAEASRGSATASRVCEPCEEGQFQNAPGNSKCAPWSRCNDMVEYASVEPTASSDRRCTAFSPACSNYASPPTYEASPPTYAHEKER